MQDTNFDFTPGELNAMQDTSFFETKWKVMEKTNGLLADLQVGLELHKDDFENLLPEEVFKLAGKINKGENYLGYPYQVLDFPRLFEKQNVFAFRTMFWWGNCFSFTLHAGGIYYAGTKQNFIRHFDALRLPGVYVCVNSNPWEYHFNEQNYIPALHFNPLLFIQQRPDDQTFIKLCYRTELTNWKTFKENGLFAFKLFCEALYSVD